MGKKAKPQDPVLSEDALHFASQAEELRLSGDELFAQGKLREALSTYEHALTLTPAKGSDRALLHANRAACFLKEHKVSDAIREGSSALEAEPNYERALVRRARAFEMAGKLDLACQDLTLACKNGGSAEALRCFQRIKVLMMDMPKGLGGSSSLSLAKGGRSSNGSSSFDRSAALGGASYSSSSSSTAAALRSRAAPQASAITVKVTCEGVTKVVAVPLTCTYADVLATVTAAFPSAGPLALRYLDTEGDMLTICSRQDMRMCIHATLTRQNREYEEASKAAAQAGLPQPKVPPAGQLPPLVMTAVPVAVSPLPPREELGSDAAESPPENDIVEIDEWLLQLSALWHTRLALPEETPVDIHAIGMETCIDVLDDVIGCAEGQALLQAACTKFQEAAAVALFHVGNVHHSAGRKRVDASLTSAMHAARDAYAAQHPGADNVPVAVIETAVEAANLASVELMEPHLEQAVVAWGTSLDVKPDYAEAGMAWGHALFEKAKLLAARAKEEGSAVTAEQVDAAFQAAADKHSAILAAMPPMPPQEDATGAAEEASDNISGGVRQMTAQEITAAELRAVLNNARILWGNILFEHSQVRHARGGGEETWKPLVEQAVTLFREAKCAELDITRALEGHPSGAWAPASEKEESEKEGEHSAAS